MGGWTTLNQDCFRCPAPNEEAFAVLCPKGVGRIGDDDDTDDIDECAVDRHICKRGTRIRHKSGTRKKAK
jgi:hypothetical protein